MNTTIPARFRGKQSSPCVVAAQAVGGSWFWGAGVKAAAATTTSRGIASKALLLGTSTDQAPPLASPPQEKNHNRARSCPTWQHRSSMPCNVVLRFGLVFSSTKRCPFNGCYPGRL